MQIDYIVCPEIIEEKLARKHHVTMREVRQALLNRPRIRFAEKGYIEGEDVYAAFSQTFGGRYLSVFFIFKPGENTKSAKPMPANKSSVSKANSPERVGEFWDKHDFTEFDNPNTPDVDFHIAAAIPIEPDLLSDIEELAHQRGVKVETLVNLWLKEKVVETKS